MPAKPLEAYENAGIARDGAKMVNAVACVDVPKMLGLRSDLRTTKATRGAVDSMRFDGPRW